MKKARSILLELLPADNDVNCVNTGTGTITDKEHESQPLRDPEQTGCRLAKDSDVKSSNNSGPMIAMLGIPIGIIDATKHLGIERYKMVTNTSPNNFSVSPMVDEKFREEKMQEFYNEEKNEKEFGIVTSSVLKERLYAYKCTNRRLERNQWFRVKILNVDLIRENAEAFLVDLEERRIVKFCDLFELCPEFWSVSVYKAKLINIKPKNGESEWGSEAIKKFKAFCQPGKIFTGFIPEEYQRKLEPNSPLPLILFQRAYGEDVSAQLFLISAGLADSVEQLDWNRKYGFTLYRN